jgi:hypothetical protein
MTAPIRSMPEMKLLRTEADMVQAYRDRMHLGPHLCKRVDAKICGYQRNGGGGAFTVYATSKAYYDARG